MKLYPGHLSDERTRIPLPIAPRADLPCKSRESGRTSGFKADFHHAAEGERKLRKGDASDRALRFVRQQWAMVADHHTGYHEVNRLHPVLPSLPVERFIYVAMAAALYLPDKAIGFSDQKRPLAEVRELSRCQRELMWERGDVEIHHHAAVFQFLARFAVEEGMPALHSRYDMELKGNFQDEPATYAAPLLTRLVELSACSTGLKELYVESRGSYMLPPQAPDSAKTFLATQLLSHMDRIENGFGSRESKSPRAMMLDVIAQESVAA